MTTMYPLNLTYAVVHSKGGVLYATFLLRTDATHYVAELSAKNVTDMAIWTYDPNTKMYEPSTTEQGTP